MPVDWPLSACATGGDRVELLARGPEGELLHGTLRGDVWNGFECIGAPQVDGAGAAIPLGLAGAPTACTREAGQMDVFAVGGTGALLHTTWNGAGFSDLESLGGLDARGGDLPIAGAISAAACGRLWMSIFARSTSGELLIKAWNGSSWSPFAPVRAPEELDPRPGPSSNRWACRGNRRFRSAAVRWPAPGGSGGSTSSPARSTANCIMYPRSSLQDTC
jgi:hypothetical protein